jgi:hypothetical protein
MPKRKKKGKQDADNFDGMLAEFQAADLTAASSSGSIPATSNSATGVGADKKLAMTPLNSAREGTGRVVSEEAIIDACKTSNFAQVRRWGRQGARVTTAEPLLRAMQVNAPFDVLTCLVKELGADVDRSNERGITALITAAFQDRCDVIRYLVEELGADVNTAGYWGRAPLWVADIGGHLGAVRILLKLRADVNHKDSDSMTPLMAAIARKHHEIVTWLLKAGADTQTIYHTSSTAPSLSRAADASAEQTAYLESKMHCSSPGCSGAGILKCTGCKQARYCGEQCQLVHWKVHKAECKRATKDKGSH